MPQIGGRDAVLHRVIYELRYVRGFAYLDRCGALINAIHETMPGWSQHGDVNPQNAPFVHGARTWKLNVSGLKLDLSWQQVADGASMVDSDLLDFAGEASQITGLVMQQLALDTNSLSRVGFRVLWLLPFLSSGEANRWLMNHDVWPPQALSSAFGEATTAELAAVMHRDDRAYLVRVSMVHRQAQALPEVPQRSQGVNERKERQFMRHLHDRVERLIPEQGVAIDVDCYQDRPGSVDIGRWVQESFGLASRAVTTAFAGST